MKLVFVLTASVLLICACAGKPEVNTEALSGSGQTMVFYGTDRDRDKTDDPEKFYGLGRGSFEYGVTRVTANLQNDKTRVEAVEPQSRGQFLNKLDHALSAARSPTLFVFIHGYNRSFDQANRLVAEFAKRTDFPGVPIVWSWPSSRKPAGYVEDQTNMQWSKPHFSEFLRTVIEESGARTVHLLAHSMGAWGLTQVMLEDLLPGGLDPDAIGEFVLLAPDIDQDLFTRDLAPQLVTSGLNITLYTSANDRAMASSKTLHGYPRAGDSSTGPLIIPGMDTIDATAANASILGHSYFEESEMVGNDLALLLNKQTPPGQRPNLNRVKFQGKIYWQLTGDE